MNDKARTIGYWVATGLLGFAFAAGGIGDLSGSPEILEGMAHLGYPAYFATILGVWKVLGAVALLVPRFPRLKEWAYAGIFFDLTGAAASHAVSGDPAGKVITPLVLLGIAAASWALRPESRKLSSESKREAGAPLAKPALAT
ncbi:DoxX family protein [Polyangium sp. 6x1]|uniref:DoxX family protein n=1 Tax=Polyangium sp. 6x1 TaxID=3042689 RepID=UPI0024821935|nr:DoxX family protein [Polyangium sp. 6x1]MDI1446055.1 DoxX family protein [Polyangium sp. 6x1]